MPHPIPARNLSKLFATSTFFGGLDGGVGVFGGEDVHGSRRPIHWVMLETTPLPHMR